jgi:hypothetical protein
LRDSGLRPWSEYAEDVFAYELDRVAPRLHEGEEP